MQSEFELLDGFREMGEMLLRIEKRICIKKSSDKSNEEINSKINTNKNDTTNLTDSSSNLMKRNNLDCVIDVVDDKVKEINHKKSSRMFSSSSSSSSSSSVIVHYHPLTGATIATERTAANRLPHTQTSTHTVISETVDILNGGLSDKHISF